MADSVRRRSAAAREAAVGVPGAIPGRRGRAGAVGRFMRSLNIWFWAIVGVPTLLAGVYYFAIASDLYLSEVKFLVRGPAKGPVGALSAILGGGLGSAAGAGSADTFAVHEFIMSRDAVRALERDNDLRTLLGRPEGDLVTRFPGIWFWRTDFEALYDRYAHFVAVEIDSTSGVSTLSVKAYRPEDALAIAEALLRDSEGLVNRLNERARQDAVGTFEREIKSEEDKIAQVQEALTRYRVEQQMLDPKSAAAGPLALLARLSAEQSAATAQLAETLVHSPQSPQIPVMRTRIATLDKLILDERGKITGAGASVAAALTEYERLDVQRQLAEKALAAAFTSLEAARLEAQRQQLYLETIAQPNLADYPLYPKRILSFATILASCLLAYAIAWLLVAGVREHAAA